MAGTSLLALLDDIATLLDDISVMSKIAAKKTAGVLGDDLALNAQQVSGVKAERELPIVWAVAKGSFRNKAILVPSALLISSFMPSAITPLLMFGGAFLCYEGFEKIAHSFLHPSSTPEEACIRLKSMPKDINAFEKEKIQGAVRTDFILSAEIVVISLGTIATGTFTEQVGVLTLISILMTIGVYGLVAGIVKLDDAGLYLSKKNNSLQRTLGYTLLHSAPYLMKTLSIAGTAAMFTVGGSILMHGTPGAHDVIHHAQQSVMHLAVIGHAMAAITPLLLEALGGLLAGAIILAIVSGVKRLLGK
ncbi:MAG: DUF808 domain-containing protein [Pseudomonadota bacterium]